MQPAVSAVGADDEGGGIAHRKSLRSHENPVIGGAVVGQIDHRRGHRARGGNRHKPRRRIGLAGARLRTAGVIDHGHTVGAVSAVQFGAGEAPLLVVQDGKQEHLLPFADAFLEAPNGGTALDLEHKKIYMRLPEGLLEVNATGATNETDEKP